MTAPEVAAVLEARGVRLFERGGSLAFAPRAKVTQADREALVAHKAEVLALLRRRRTQPALGGDWSRVSLYQLDRVLEVAVPWSDERLVIAPGCRIARELRATDPKPGRVWCVCEVSDLLLSGVKPEDARRIGEAKLAFGGAVVGVLKEPGS